jgi:phosphoserine phosphatase
MKKPESLLMVADSEHDANMLYAVGMFVPDPFIWLRSRGRHYVVMSDLIEHLVHPVETFKRALNGFIRSQF